MAAKPATFIRRFLSEFLESRFLIGALDQSEYHDLLAALERARYESIAAKLFARSPKSVNVPGYGRLRIVKLREIGGTEFPFLQGLAGSTARRKLTCFVGHRFLPGIEKSLRYNLAQLLTPYNIQLRWSGYDLSAAGLFSDIVDGIQQADLCFFDNLGTLNRPNVYVEVGIAHAAQKPMIVTEYVGPKKQGTIKVADAGSVPSDLQGLFRIQYKTYEELCKTLYFGLPSFFERYGLRKGRPSSN